ncbi:hypothetical protein EC991_010025 [Linnemannia zychae]|nr:hypothetical protein EC991_010025 [Linnemannia zychae]
MDANSNSNLNPNAAVDILDLFRDSPDPYYSIAHLIANLNVKIDDTLRLTNDTLTAVAEQTRRINSLDEQLKAYHCFSPGLAPGGLEDPITRLITARLDSIIHKQNSTLGHLAHQISKWLDAAGGEVANLGKRIDEVEKRASWNNDSRQARAVVSHEHHGSFSRQSSRRGGTRDSRSDSLVSDDDTNGSYPSNPPKKPTVGMEELELRQTIEQPIGQVLN